MGKVRVAGFGVSIDGFGAGPDQGLEHPLGKRGQELMNWFFPTLAFRSMIGKDGGTDDRFAEAAMEGFGAFILGRNMFGPAGDDWGGPDWKGWWGDNPPYRRADLHPHPPCPGANRDGGRDDLPFRYRRDRGGACRGKGRRGRPGRKDRRGRCDRSASIYSTGAIDEMHLALSPGRSGPR